MKKNLNVIQINGTRGILMVVGFLSCAAAGFIYFPGWVCMHIWNFISGRFDMIPSIGIFQGILLWAIIAAAYYTFRKDKLVVCMHSSDGLSEDELKQVFADLKQQSKNDALIQSMLKAREADLKIKDLSKTSIPKIEAKEHQENKY